MIIENPDALRTWLTACLEPKCDADPAALAKYVMALVKKDKPETELREICLDQLDVFLQKGTKPFVDLLFETLSDKSYLKQLPTLATQSLNGAPSALETEKTVNENAASPSLNGSAPLTTPAVTTSASTIAAPTVPLPMVAKPLQQPVAMPVAPVNQGATASTPPAALSSAIIVQQSPKVDGKRPKSGNESDEREVKRSRVTARSKSRSKSPLNRRGKNSDPRDMDDRRNRRFPDDNDRRRRNFQSRRYDNNRYRDFRRGSGSGQDMNDRERDRDRDFRLQRSKDRNASSSNAGRGGNSGNRMQNDRSKSQSRSRSNSPWKRARSWSRSRSNSRSRSPSHSRSRSWSRTRERNRDAPRDSHAVPNNSTTSGSNLNEHGDKDYRNTASSGSAPTSVVTTGQTPANSSGPLPAPTAPATTSEGAQQPTQQQPAFRGKNARRCRDYDEKGYCMRGDLCPFDHGMDPVVLEDVSVLGFGPNSTNVPPPPPHGPPSHLPPPPPGATMPPMLPPMLGQSAPALGAPLSGPNLASLPPPAEPFIPEPYNPEAPGMERPSRMHNAFWNHPPPSGPPGQGPNLRPMGPRGPPHMFHSGPPPRARELIGVPTVDNPELSSNSNNNNRAPKSVICRTVLEPLQPHPDTENNAPVNQEVPRPHMGYGGPRRGGHDVGGGFRRRIFDYNRLAPRKMQHHNVERCTLELRKVPRHQNSIAELNTHFSKFGTIVNLQVCFGGDPEGALVQFSSHNEANAAYRCTDAVLNNRFIKVFWHNKENNNTPATGGANTNSGGVAQNEAANIINNNNQSLNAAATENREPGVATTNLAAGGVSIKATSEAGQVLDSAATAVKVSPKPSIKERLGINTAMTKVNNIVKKNNLFGANNATNTEDTTEKHVLFTPTGNLSRTVFNPAALKKNNVVANAAGARKTKEEQKKDALKKKLEVQTKRQEFIQRHVQQQKLLVEKLEKCKVDKEKTKIKETLVSLSKTIEELQADVRKEATEITTLNKAIMAAVPKSKTEAEKELLDAEMDLYNKQHRGDDTTELKKKVLDLKQQAKALGLLDSSGQLRLSMANAIGSVFHHHRGAGMRFRGAHRGGGRGGPAGAMMVPRKLTSFDRRPKKLLVQGNLEGDKNELMIHFSQFAQIERLESVENSAAVVATFKTRRDAEKVLSMSAKYKDQVLKFSWFVDPALCGAVDSLEAGLDNDLHVNDENLDQSEDEDILLGDDEEEEDSEARSWRR